MIEKLKADREGFGIGLCRGENVCEKCGRRFIIKIGHDCKKADVKYECKRELVMSIGGMNVLFKEGKYDVLEGNNGMGFVKNGDGIYYDIMMENFFKKM